MTDHRMMSREPVEHDLKILPDFFRRQKNGTKTAEIRKDDCRDFRIGDTLLLREWLPRKKVYTGRKLRRLIVGIDWMTAITGIVDSVPWAVLYTKEVEVRNDGH